MWTVVRYVRHSHMPSAPPFKGDGMGKKGGSGEAVVDC